LVAFPSDEWLLKHVQMTRLSSRPFLNIFLWPLAILSNIAAQGAVVGVPARGQVLRPVARVAYLHNGNIWILDGPTGRRTRLTIDGHDSAPRWTSDGQTLLFQGQRGGRFQILRWQPGKGHPQAGTRRLRDGLWSPDGQWLFFVRRRGHYQGKTAEAALWAVRTDGTDPQRIARLNVPGGFLNGFGYYGSFGWKGLFDVAP
jgi:dipeptidyl aminopeptidase/acylaminoacyl peptidase